MPELPEVETTRLGVSPHIVGKKVNAVVVRNGSLRWPVPSDLEDKILGQKLVSISRRGKYLILEFSTGCVLWHLGMSGSLRIVKPSEPPMIHDHIDVRFGANSVLRFRDPRRFGCVLWAEDVHNHKLIKSLGPEPLSEAFCAEYLYARTRKRSLPVKSFIMDSKTVVGVGNIYANEALFLTGVRPTKPAGKLTKDQVVCLVEEIKKVLALAIKSGGTTLKDFVNSDGKPGYFAQELFVYGRGGMPCKKCKAELIEEKLGQRSTVHCRHCQK